jgi:preprotein translocase subunit SecG
MQNVVLIVHLVLALGLIGIVLMQRSEGGGLGIGGGGGATTGRPASTPLGKFTWALAVAFIATSMTLTILAAQNSAGSSVVDQIGIEPRDRGTAEPELPSGADLLPPAPGDDAPLVPRAE